eukprot:6032075-Amphidinium_carterae.2
MSGRSVDDVMPNMSISGRLRTSYAEGTQLSARNPALCPGDCYLSGNGLKVENRLPLGYFEIRICRTWLWLPKSYFPYVHNRQHLKRAHLSHTCAGLIVQCMRLMSERALQQICF